jgi:epoxide hydrolase-like predicted phosphatase
VRLTENRWCDWVNEDTIELMKIRAVIFDLGGVLVRTEDRRPRAELARRLGMTYDEISRLVFESDSARLATLGKITTREHWERIRLALGSSMDDFPGVRRDFWGGDKLDAGLVEYIRCLRPRFKTGLLSNAWDNLRQVITHTWEIADAFDDIVISAEVGMAKPDPQIYELAVQRLGVPASEAIFVDDFSHNIEAANRVGLHGIRFVTPQQVLQDLDRFVDPI